MCFWGFFATLVGLSSTVLYADLSIDLDRERNASYYETGIEMKEGYSANEPVASLYNRLGMKCLEEMNYELAIQYFEKSSRLLCEEGAEDSVLFGAALWGKLFSHAYAQKDQDAYHDLELIQNYYQDRCSCVADLYDPYSAKIYPAAQFADPDERISSRECKDRVMGTANTMRILAIAIPNQELGATVGIIISELERFASGCCEDSHWTKCLSPIIDAWSYLKDCMDKGVAIAPKILISPR